MLSVDEKTHTNPKVAISANHGQDLIASHAIILLRIEMTYA